MARRYRCLLSLLVLVVLPASPAVAQKGLTKKEKEAKIKALEGLIHQMHEQEKATQKQIDHRYDHIIRNLDPKEIHHQMEEAVKVLRHVHEVITTGDFDYGGHRHAAQESTKAAEHQLEKALKHDTAEERAKASKDLLAAHTDINKALRYSVEKYGLGTGRETGEPESRAAANRQLTESIAKIELAHHLLAAVGREITDYKQEKHDLLKQRDAEKKMVHEQYAANVKPLAEEIKALKK